MTDAVIDTVAFIHHLQDSLPPAAERVFHDAESGTSQLFLPEVALGEFAYLALRGRIKLAHPRATVEEVLNGVRGTGYIQTCALGPAGWAAFLDLQIPELHDRMIGAVAASRALPLVTNDPAFRAIPSVKLIWR